MSITIQKSTGGAYWTLLDSKDNLLRPFMVNDYDFIPDIDGVSFSMEARYGKSPDRFKIIDKVPYTSVFNGDTTAVFGSFAALQTYVLTNFFRNPNATPGGGVWGSITGTLSAQIDLQTALNGKQAAGSYQAALVSGTNIKTINSASILGSGNIIISGSAAWGSITGTLSSQTDLFNSIPKIFNVKTYGAVGDGVTDDTVAIQTTINAVYTARGGVVYFPMGVYLVHGALVNGGGANIGSPNSQLYIKYESTFVTAAGSIPITFLGEVAPSPNVSVLANYTINPNSVIIYSDITGSGTYPSILGSDFSVSGAGNLNPAYITIKNINFRVKGNIGASGPTMSCANLSNIGFAKVDGVVCELDVSLNNSVLPVAETFGIYMPKNGNGAYNPISDSMVAGFKYGYICPEHTTGNNNNAVACEHGFVFPGGDHAVWFGRLGVYWCKNGISGPVGTIATTSPTIQDIRIAQLDIEWEPNTTGNWFDNNFTVLDASNKLYGRITYHAVQRGIGKNYTGFTMSGGANLRCEDQDGSNFSVGTNIYCPQITGSLVTGQFLTLLSNFNLSGKTRILWGTRSCLDDLHDRIGIGTQNPVGMLTLNAATGSSAYMDFTKADVRKWEIGTDVNAANVSDLYIYDSANGAVRQYFDTSGNLFLGGSNASLVASCAIKLFNNQSVQMPHYTAGVATFDASGNITSSAAPLIKASVDLTAQTAAGNVATFTVGAATATFNISSYINVTAVSVDVIQGQITYTDENNTAQTISLASLSAIGNSAYSPITIRAKNATVITVKTNLTTGAGSITFDTGARITQL